MKLPRKVQIYIVQPNQGHYNEKEMFTLLATKGDEIRINLKYRNGIRVRETFFNSNSQDTDHTEQLISSSLIRTHSD